MINRKEIIAILISILVVGFSVNLFDSWNNLGYAFLIVLAVFAVNILAKKIAAYYLDSKIQIKLWEMQKFGFRKHHYLEKPFPIGLLLALLTSAISFGNFIWITPLTFEVEPEVYRASKRHGLYSFSEMTESHIGLIAAAGIFANLVFVFIGYLLGEDLFTKLNIMFAFFNMIPLSNLDGNKIFFGNITLWSFLAALTLIAIGYLVFLV
jgi:Zn-dependent protease